MDERAFVDQKSESWKSFAAALDKIQSSGAKTLPRQELSRIGDQYRVLVSDLSYARTMGASDSLVDYLNDIAGRAHGVIYSGKRANAGGIKNFLKEEFPRAFRESARYVLFAAIVFWAGLFLGIYLASTNAELIKQWTPPKIDDPAGASSFIMTNNMKVGILAFATGISAGILTLWVVFSNGVMLGAIGAALSPVKRAALWTFVMPHGIIELTAIFICGGAGLMIGSSIIAPGNLRRGDAVRIAAGKALKLFAGTIPMFIIAGIIEGFVSPSPIPRWSKFLFSGLTALALVLYLGFAGRKSKSAPCS